MKKLFTLLTLVSVLFVCSLNATAQTKKVFLAWGNMGLSSDGVTASDGRTYNNVLTGKEKQNNGFSMWLSVEKKAYSAANKISATIDGAPKEYTTIKPSNGAPNVITIPDGLTVTKVTLVSYINYDIAAKGKEGRTSYWKTVGDLSFDAETAEVMTCWITKTENKKPVYAGDFDVRSFDVNATDSLTITQTGEQACFWVVLECVEASASQTVTISDAKFATCVANTDLDFAGTDVTAYTVNEVGETTVTLVKTDKVKAGQAVVVGAEAAGAYDIPTTTEEFTAAINLMAPSETEVPVTTENSYYIVANGDNGVGFYPVQTGTSIPAGKGYIEVPANSAQGRFLSFGIGGGTNGISDVKAATAETGEIYNLNGQRVAAPAKGLYIMNGKKVIFK